MNDLIRRSDVADKLTRIINEMEEIFSSIRMKLVDDSVCGLCEYDCDHGIDGYANECPGFEKDDCFKLKDEYRKEWTSTKDLPSAEPEIIRCKDCKHREVENGFCEGRGWPMQLVPDDGFCDKGERNEE